MGTPQSFTFRELPPEIEEVLFKYEPVFPSLRPFLSVQLYLQQFLLDIQTKSDTFMIPLHIAAELSVLEMFGVIKKDDIAAAVTICQETGQYLPEVLIKMMQEQESPSPEAHIYA